MAKSRMIAKSCPKCAQQVAVASKTCKCGYSFFNARRVIRGSTPEVERRRRTGRVRREKPNFYDSQQFDKKKKRKKVLAQRSKLVEVEEKQLKKETAAVRAKRRQKRKEEDGDLAAKLTKDKQDLAEVILAEINRKISSVDWSPR